MSFFNIGLIRGFSSTGFPTMNATRPDLLPDKVIWSWAGNSNNVPKLFVSYLIINIPANNRRLNRTAWWLLRYDIGLSIASSDWP